MNKTLTIDERLRAVGPGGGIGHPKPTKKDGSGSGGGTGRTPVHIHLDDHGKRTLTGFMDDHYAANADADRRYDERQAAMGRG